jgi:hypothetical protein
MRYTNRRGLLLVFISLSPASASTPFHWNTSSALASAARDSNSLSPSNVSHSTSLQLTSQSPFSGTKAASSGIPGYIMQGLALLQTDSTSFVTSPQSVITHTIRSSGATLTSLGQSLSSLSPADAVVLHESASQGALMPKPSQQAGLNAALSSSNATRPGTSKPLAQLYTATNTTTAIVDAFTFPPLASFGSGSAYASLCNEERLSYSSLYSSASPNISWTISWSTDVQTYTDWSAKITSLGGCDTVPRVVGGFTLVVSSPAGCSCLRIRLSHETDDIRK